MKLKKAEILHIAKLARLQLNEKEIEKYRLDLSSILEYAKTLQEVDTEKVEITAQVSGLQDVFREDVAKEWDREELELSLSQGEREKGNIKVKRVL